MKYFVVKDLNTGLYFLGNGVNKWGRYFNQASIYRIKGATHSSIKYLETRGYDVELVPIKIIETDKEVTEVRHGTWTNKYRSGNPVSEGYVSSCCDMWHKSKTDFCPYCGAYME